MVMDLPKAVDIDALSSACLVRPRDAIFSLDGHRQASFDEICRDKVVLITGAAGFIARATLEHVLDASPRILYLLDSSENGLADLARELVLKGDRTRGLDIRMRLVDVSSSLLEAAVESQVSVDVALHFAAAKHVRSERDLASALRILDVNVLGTKNLLRLLETRGDGDAQVFAVSTDKAAEPTSLMGASKLIMESLLWEFSGRATSARFANVLFSHGSLTEAWISRLSCREPLSSPVGTFRYLVSRQEAGSLCANATVAKPDSVVIPAADSLAPLALEDLVERFLNHFDKRARFVPLAEYESNPDSIVALTDKAQEYPVVLTPLDTVGEKTQEIFSASHEFPKHWAEDLDRFDGIPLPGVGGLIKDIGLWVDDPVRAGGLDGIRERLGKELPTYVSNQSGATLDGRI